jgi:hypothetical protein
VVLLLAVVLAGAQADYFAPEAVEAFAAHLFAQGDYLRAGYEYERYLLGPLLEGDSPASAHELAGRAFRCGGDFPRALEHFRGMRETAVDPAQRERAAAEIGLCHLHLGEAEASLREVRGETGWEASASLRRIAAGDLILLGRWEEARQAAPQPEAASWRLWPGAAKACAARAPRSRWAFPRSSRVRARCTRERPATACSPCS